MEKVFIKTIFLISRKTAGFCENVKGDNIMVRIFQNH